MENPSEFAPSVHDNHHNHTWMIVLSIACFALIGALGGLFAFQYYEPQATVVDSTPVENDALFNDEEPDKSPEVITATYDGSITFPTFEYPSTWNLYGDIGLASGALGKIILNNGPIFRGEGGYFFPITIMTYLKSSFLNGLSEEEYMSQLPEKTLDADNWIVQKIKINENNVYIVSGRQDMGNYPFEQIIYFSNLYMVSVYYTELGDNLETEWEIIKNSLDFSKIK